ncbi:MAG: sulfatase [Myxococcota bacterium]|nr:sulfatase [Myxococcota bacterium]
MSKSINAALCTWSTFGLMGVYEGFNYLTGEALETSTALAAAVGLAALLAIPFALIAFVIYPNLADYWSPTSWHRRYLTEGDKNIRVAWAATVYSSLLGVMSTAGIVAFLGGVAHDFNQKLMTMAFLGLGSFAAAMVGVIVTIGIRPVVRAILNKLTSGGRPLVLFPVIVAVLGGLLILIMISRMDLGAYRIERFTSPILALVGSYVLFAITRNNHTIIHHLVRAVGAVTLLCGGLILTGDDDWSKRASTIVKQGASSQLTLNVLRTLTDNDGDGFSDAFAGGDCNDADPLISPKAKEIPDNNIDENCRGGDLKTEVKPEKDESDKAPEKIAVAPRIEAKPYNIVFIMIDTLRPDRLGIYGYTRETSPNIDAFARKSVLFENVYGQAPNTPRSFPSMITGRYPSRISWEKRYANYGQLTDANQTLFKIFGAAGWRTEMVSAHWYFEKAKGFEKGIHFWDNRGALSIKKSNTQSAAPLITQKIMTRLDELEKRKQRFVLFAHYFDPHSRYMNHPDVKVFGKKGLSNKYDSEIAFVDHHIKPVLERLDSGIWARNTIVVLTSDHGEAFKEHGFYFHGRTVYNEEVKVTLIIRIPGAESKRIKTTIGLVDLLPTLGEMTGVKTETAMGESMVGLWTGTGTIPRKPVFVEQLPYPNYKTHMVAAIDRSGQFKVIQNVTDNILEIFDLRSDPKEKKNLLDSNPDGAKSLRQALEQFLDADPG